MPKNIFVLGLDELNLNTLRDLPHLSRYRFHPLLDIDDLVATDTIDFVDLLDRAKTQLDDFDGEIDAIIGYWDFPVSSLVPILCDRFGFPSPPLEAVVKCEHKYWSRLEQRAAINEYPRFGLVDLDDPEVPEGVRPPMWLKPVKSFSSDLAFRVTGNEDFNEAIDSIREGIGKVGKPFDDLLGLLDLPPEIEAAGGMACLAEEAVSGLQATVEGYRAHGRTRAFGVIDSINYEGTSSFLRYQYPSQLPEHVRRRLIDVSERIIEHIGLEPSTFNIEYFWNRETDEIHLLEINPRLSQSHALLFELVDGTPNHQCMVSLALGEDPGLPYREGRHRIAGKWFLRRFSDGVVRQVPTDDEIARIQDDFPGTTITIIPGVGDRLSDLPGQDSYSYELADIFIGARDEADLTDRYDQVVASLDFQFDP